ncbi:unnamed protein product [Rhizopus microsporus]
MSGRRDNVILDTSMGSIHIELYWDHAPRTCKNFYELAKKGYYDGVSFHRIIADFMIQGGDPTGTGRGGTSIYGEQFAMKSIRLLNILEQASLVWPMQDLIRMGLRVSDGMNVVKRMGLVKTNAHDRPKDTVRIERCRFE